MQIDYIGNTGFLVTLKSGKKIALDWWISTPAFHGAWSLFPPLRPSDRDYYLAQNKPDYIYVSHLHSDHLDPEVIARFDPQTPVIIGKRGHPHLTRSLIGMGLKNIVEVAFEEEHSFGSFSVVLFDDFSTDPDCAGDQVAYQLDSSILVKDTDGVSFLNLNDNIPQRGQAERIAQTFGSPDAAALVCSSASSYPQSFLNYDDEEMAVKQAATVQKTTGRFFDVMSGLRPKVALPCGGAVLNGALAPRNRFAQMGADEKMLARRRGDMPAGSELVIMGTRDRLDIDSEGARLHKHALAPVSLPVALAEAAERRLDHELICIPGSFKVFLPNLLRRARQNLWRRQESLCLFPDWQVTLRTEPLGQVQPGDAVGPIALSYTFDLKSPEPVAAPDPLRPQIEFVLDARLLLMVLISAAVWDNLYTSSMVQTRREPDVFDTNVTKLMSFFAA
ncbi:MAG: MBL fold metallo-hydrolase [Kiloniellaceae bacterium]